MKELKAVVLPLQGMRREKKGGTMKELKAVAMLRQTVAHAKEKGTPTISNLCELILILLNEQLSFRCLEWPVVKAMDECVIKQSSLPLEDSLYAYDPRSDEDIFLALAEELQFEYELYSSARACLWCQYLNSKVKLGIGDTQLEGYTCGYLDIADSHLPGRILCKYNEFFSEDADTIRDCNEILSHIGCSNFERVAI